MPSKAVSDAFEARLATWSHLPLCPFVDFDVVSNVQAPPYIELEYPAAVETFASAGTRKIARETGGVRFVITVASFSPGWKAQLLGWVDELRDLFRGADLDGGVETFEAGPAIFDPRNKAAAGTKISVPFVVTYKYDVIKSPT